MEKMEKNNNSLQDLRPVKIIAKRVGCSEDYVKMVLRGARTPKTDRATKAAKVLEVAKQIQEMYDNINQPNN